MNEDLLKTTIETMRLYPGLTGRQYTNILHIKDFPDLNRHFLNSSILYRYPNILKQQAVPDTKPNEVAESE